MEKPLLDIEISGIDSDLPSYFAGELLLPQEDRILADHGGNLEIYQRVLQDDQVKSCLQQRFSGLLSCPWKVEAATNSRADRKAADWCRELVESLKFKAIVNGMLFAVFYGYSIAELMLTKGDDGLITLDIDAGGIRVRDRSRFRFDRDGSVRLVSTFDWQGQVLHGSRIWRITFGGSHSDDPYGHGLASWLYRPVFLKGGGLTNWLDFLERFVKPSVGVTIPVGASDSEKAKAKNLAQAVRSGSSFFVTSGTEISFYEATRSGTADYRSLIEICDAAISKIVLSQTMTTDDGSSLAQAEVHSGVAQAVIETDAELIAESFNDQVLSPLCRWNFPAANPPVLLFETDSKPDTKLIAERDKILVDMGLSPTLDYIKATYGEGFLPPQNTDSEPVTLSSEQVDSLLQVLQLATSGRITANSAKMAVKLAFPRLSPSSVEQLFDDPSSPSVRDPLSDPLPGEASFSQGQQKTVNDFIGQLRGQANPLFRDWLNRIRQAIEQGQDLEQIADTIVALYPELPSGELVDLIAQAATAAGLAGFYESQQGS